ncbi:uncharacterized protein LOC122512890 [Leptopilina heterotoma]|uniref:uncharacterized protein LOC122512890 n=1 Tax=Leptopilina heterotoma TaxID=63436 RepID=UPI001CAA05A3|nr:uncharacterized protein LOC122512890 [Leptopilina heterotoma]XP_043484957.1 uncharacterized protein LOC122512890 [Leptopilina heterotoma]
MKIIIVLGSIVTIILVTLPVFEFTRISADDRKMEFKSFKMFRRMALFKYYVKPQLTQILKWLDNFVMNLDEIREFGRYSKENGHSPEWMKTQELKNPKLYQSLRYDTYVEFISSSKNETIQRIKKLQKKIFQGLPVIPAEKIYDDYVSLDMNELISLKDYYAIQVLLKNYHSVYMKNPVGWRMKRALYSLAIRQYSEDLNSTFSQKICFTQLFKETQLINNLSRNRNFSFKNFLYCIGRNAFKERLKYSFISNNTDSTFNAEYSKIVITDPRLIVNLQEVTNDDDRDDYFILPTTQLVVEKGLFDYKTPFGLVKAHTLKTLPIKKNSEWLTTMANNIEEYKEKEREYFLNIFSNQISTIDINE